MNQQQLELPENEVWSGEDGELAGAIGDILRASGRIDQSFLSSVIDTVDLTAGLIFNSSFTDFFVVTEHPTDGATCNVTCTFLSDKFRMAVASSAYQRLIEIGHNIPIDGLNA